ncbi:hypothetical protein COF80_26935 [Bacillus toyonensis]|uniref:hypothetical protein n=1 Tax=Bacillus toyonensis TaxID=155322 RepID=UPI000BFBB3BE|nr:hypothetical protein [Bacillus toyonensis]PHE82663.1 hypothetical protein COF80_26935 [Bacillus toyonensis]
MYDSTQGKCAISGHELNLTNPASIHIDRDLGGGDASLYKRNNVQLTLGVFNFSKGDNNLESFLMEMARTLVYQVKNDKKYKRVILNILKDVKNEIP